MKKMKKLLALGMAGAMVLGLAACGGGSTNTPSTGDNNGASTGDNSASTDHKAVTLKLQGAFAEGTDHYYYFDTFCQRVNELSDGSVTVEWGAGPESIPSDQLAEAMQNGVVELVYSPFTYLTTVSPALGGVKLIDAFEARENGGFEYIDNLSQQVLNCHFLARTAVNSPYVLMSNVEITSLDSFKGVVFRGTAAHRPLLEALGAEVVTMGWADVYSAVDKNVVSGVGGTYRDFVDNDLGGKVKSSSTPASTAPTLPCSSPTPLGISWTTSRERRCRPLLRSGRPTPPTTTPPTTRPTSRLWKRPAPRSSTWRPWASRTSSSRPLMTPPGPWSPTATPLPPRKCAHSPTIDLLTAPV